MGFFRRLFSAWIRADSNATPRDPGPETGSVDAPATARRAEQTPGDLRIPRLPFLRGPAAKRAPPEQPLPDRAARILALLDAAIARQSSIILGQARLQRLESSWRGLHHLVEAIAAGGSEQICIRLLTLTREELAREALRTAGPAQSVLFRQVQDAQFRDPYGEPFSVLIGDFEWGAGYEDTRTLRAIAAIAAASHAPFVTAASPAILGLSSWADAPAPEGCLDALPDRWRDFHQTPEGAFVTLTMPRLRARAAATTADGAALPACWVNGAYLVGARLGAAFLGDGLGSTVGDAEGVAGFGSAECPIDVEEALEVVRHGILPLVTASQGAPVSPGPSALAAGLPALMVRCRFAHYVAMVGRERMRGGDIEGRAGLKVAIDEWFSSYLKPDAQFRRPLYQAKVAVRPDLKNPQLCVAAVEFRLWPPGGEISDVMRIAVALPAPE